jgi:hypothetical protein
MKAKITVSEQQRITAQDVGDELLDAMAAIWRWLVLVAAVAIGTCLGITLFVVLVMGLIAGRMHDVNFSPFTTTTTPTWSLPHSP